MARKTNEDSVNQNTHNSMGSFSKKSTFRQMTKPLLNSNRNVSIPRLNELLNDQIFQYYFRKIFNTKDYSKFKFFSENEKINIMIDLYFYIMNKASNDYIEEERLNDNETDNENESTNAGLEKLLDNLLVLDYNQSRMNVLEKMKEYKLFSLNDENNYNERFNKILNKYKNIINNDNNDETINYYYDKTERNADNNLNNINNKTGSYSNLNYNSKPLSTNRYNNKTNSNNGRKISDKNNPNYNYNDDIKGNNDNDTNMFNELIAPYKKNNIYEKINISNIKMIKFGKIRKKKLNFDDNVENNRYIEYLLAPKEYEIKSKKNDIKENENNYLYNNEYQSPINYKAIKPKITTKMKSNISPLIYNDNDNGEIIIQEPIVISHSNIDNCKMNLLLKKQINEDETNELIKKIYQFDGEYISFNRNEINKIGILLLNYIKLEKKYDIIETNLFIYKEKLFKMKEIMQIFSKKSMERINNSNAFIREQKLN